MKRVVHSLSIAAVLLALAMPLAAQQAAELQQLAARNNPFANEEPMLAATSAGRRLIAVGDHGTILLSDDGGRTFHQAKSVPTRVTLNGVSFADAMNGWAVGHWGTILRTGDGGETWTLQRTDTSTDRPLFAVHVFDTEHVVAVGLWSLALVTGNGGGQWREVALPAPPGGGKADRNLLGAFAGNGGLYAPAERGLVLFSNDRGNTWSYLGTGYKGSLWSGIALGDGTLLVGGLRGTIFRSGDKGRTWQAIDSGTRSSITGFSETAGGVVAVALDGIVLQSKDGGMTFRASQRDDRSSLTAVVANANGRPIAFSKRGVVGDLSLPK